MTTKTDTAVTGLELFAAIREICCSLDPITALVSAMRYQPHLRVDQIVDDGEIAPLLKALDAASELLQRGYRDGVRG